jgi:hypothetical protein
MAASVLGLQALQVKAYKFVTEYDLAWQRDHQWLHDIYEEAHKLFQRPEPKEADDEVEEHDTPGPILLPQTPRIKSARAERMQRKTK